MFPLKGDRCTIGKDSSNSIAVPDDSALSRLHTALQHYEAGWAIRDLGSTNGTYVNGERIWGERQLRAGDEIRVGATIIIFKSASAAGPLTEAAEPPPELTRREREVLIALCRPVLGGAMFTRPASIREIAAEMFVTEGAVKQHLSRLYDKFGIYSEGERITALANEAIRRGAVSLADLK